MTHKSEIATVHFFSMGKYEADLGWETLETRANFLGLCQFQKFHLKLTRPLILSIMPTFNTNRKTRNTDLYINFPKKSHAFSILFSLISQNVLTI